MNLMQGKKGIIFGVSNKRGIAYAIADVLHKAGAEIAFTYFGDPLEKRVRAIAEEMNSKLIVPCDVTNESQIESTFKEYAKVYNKCDFIIHAVALANPEEMGDSFLATTKQGWDLAMSVSAYSLIPITKFARPLMQQGGSIVTLTYLGAERSIPNYNIMGVAKAALESTVRYLAAELGPQNIRVNALSSGPVKTLSTKAIKGFEKITKIYESATPLKRNITLEDIGKSALYLTSDLSSGVTGEVHHVDSGFHSVAMVKEDAL